MPCPLALLSLAIFFKMPLMETLSRVLALFELFVFASHCSTLGNWPISNHRKPIYSKEMVNRLGTDHLEEVKSIPPRSQKLPHEFARPESALR